MRRPHGSQTRHWEEASVLAIKICWSYRLEELTGNLAEEGDSEDWTPSRCMGNCSRWTWNLMSYSGHETPKLCVQIHSVYYSWSPCSLWNEKRFKMLARVGTVEIIQFKLPILWKWELRPLSWQGQAGSEPGLLGPPAVLSAVIHFLTGNWLWPRGLWMFRTYPGSISLPLKIMSFWRVALCSVQFYPQEVAWCLPHVKLSLFAEWRKEGRSGWDTGYSRKAKPQPMQLWCMKTLFVTPEIQWTPPKFVSEYDSLFLTA